MCSAGSKRVKNNYFIYISFYDIPSSRNKFNKLKNKSLLNTF